MVCAIFIIQAAIVDRRKNALIVSTFVERAHVVVVTLSVANTAMRNDGIHAHVINALIVSANIVVVAIIRARATLWDESIVAHVVNTFVERANSSITTINI